MEALCFRCDVCGEIVRMKKNVPPLFTDWGYDACVEWSDFCAEVPALSQRHWERSSNAPVKGETRRVYVRKPFDEVVGSEFWVKFEPALLHFNGWEEASEADIRNCAMVRCRFERILQFDAVSAWIEVSILQVIPLDGLYRCYEEHITPVPLDCFGGWQRETETLFQNDRWQVVGWSAQGDCGETRWIYTDEDSKRHLVLALRFGFDEEVLYLGNVTASETR